MRDRHGNTPLHLACLNNQKECIKQLLTPLTLFERSVARGIESFPQDLELWNYDGKFYYSLMLFQNLLFGMSEMCEIHEVSFYLCEYNY